MRESVSKFLNLVSNIRNWYLYTFYKERRHKHPINFITKPNSLQLTVDEENYAVFKEIFVEDFYKINSIIKQSGTEPVVIDIGANRGLFCAMMLSKKPGCTIFAYEPLPENSRELQKFKKLNEGKTKNLYLFDEAVSGTGEKTITIYTGGSEIGSIASIYKDFDKRNSREIKVPATTLPEIFNNVKSPVIDILKIDCEGAEYPILYNTPKDILRRASTMVIEAHELDKDTRNAASLGIFLQSNGFIVTTEKFRNDCYLVTAINNHSDVA